MKVLTGIDIVSVSDFAESFRSGGASFANRLFTSNELKNPAVEHLAGVFAAKEAIVKALSLNVGCWLEIEIRNREDGRPEVMLKQGLFDRIESCDLSISHNNMSAVAVFVAIV